MNPQDTQAMYDSLDALTEGTGLNVKTTKELLEKDGSYNPPLSFDVELDEILNHYGEYAVLKDVNQFDNVSMEREFPDLPNRAKAKQAIKQLIASHLGAIIDDNMYPDFDANGSDFSSVYESIVEWMGELQGGGA